MLRGGCSAAGSLPSPLERLSRPSLSVVKASPFRPLKIACCVAAPARQNRRTQHRRRGAASESRPPPAAGDGDRPLSVCSSCGAIRGGTGGRGRHIRASSGHGAASAGHVPAARSKAVRDSGGRPPGADRNIRRRADGTPVRRERIRMSPTSDRAQPPRPPRREAQAPGRRMQLGPSWTFPRHRLPPCDGAAEASDARSFSTTIDARTGELFHAGRWSAPERIELSLSLSSRIFRIQSSDTATGQGLAGDHPSGGDIGHAVRSRAATRRGHPPRTGRRGEP